MSEQLTLERDASRLELVREDHHIEVAWRLAGGYQPPRVPLLALNVIDRQCERQERVERFRIDRFVHDPALGQGVHVVLKAQGYPVVVGMWIDLTEAGELSLTLAPAEVEEREPELYRVASVEWVPGLMRAERSGCMLLPLNTGVLCHVADKPAVEDRFLIYGEQERWELLPTTPVCAVHGPEGGLSALADHCPHDMYCHVRTDGAGAGSTGLYPMLRRQWVDPVDWAIRRVRIAPLTPEDDPVVTTGHRLRRHLLEDHAAVTLKQRAEQSPRAAFYQRAYTMKLFHAVQRQGGFRGAGAGGGTPEDGSLFVRSLTFPDAERRIRRLKEAGVERAYIQPTGWNVRGHDGAFPTVFPVELRLGGEAGLRRLIETAKSLGYQIAPHMNLRGASRSSPELHRAALLTDAWGEPKVTGYWGGGITHTHWPPARPKDDVVERLSALEDMGFDGMMYLDGMANPLWVNHDPQHRGTRRDYADGVAQWLRWAKEICGSAGTEMCYLYAALEADASVCGGGFQWQFNQIRDEWPIAHLLDRRVPLFDLAAHELVTTENHGLEWPQTMRGILMGHVPRDEWAAEPGIMPVIDDRRIAKIKARYDLMCDRFGHLVSEPLVDWQQLGEHAQKTRFGDGTEVTADFEEQRLWVNGEEIRPPQHAANPAAVNGAPAAR